MWMHKIKVLYVPYVLFSCIYCIVGIYCERNICKSHNFALRTNVCNFLLLCRQQEIDRRYMDPKCVLALMFANVLKITKFAKLKDP